MSLWQDQVVAHAFDGKHRSDDVRITEQVTFEELLLSEKVLHGLKKSGFYKPSPIQLKAIPLGRCGLDLIVQAKSGTGKTCVFAVIALDAVNVKSPSLQMVILAPTREIALQIHGVISCIGQDMEGLSVQVFIGGTLVSEDRIKAKKCHIAIGSPGRLKQLIELNVLNTSMVRMFVLDEADKLIEEGSFQKQINWIYSSLPENKQMLALSATYPEELAQFLARYMREPHYVRLDANHPSLLGLRQYVLVVRDCSLPHLLFEEKARQVIQLLSNVTFQQVLVFSNYHSRAESICEALNSSGWPSTFISGNMEQSKRTEAINMLKQFKCRVLISTDLTSRGIDAQNVDMVINMDVPHDWETYLHRIGRAGRYGSRGIAVSIVCEGEEASKLDSIAEQCNAPISHLTDIKELNNITTEFKDIFNDNVVCEKTVKSSADTKRIETALGNVENDSTAPMHETTPESISVDTACEKLNRVESEQTKKRNCGGTEENELLKKLAEPKIVPVIPSLKDLQMKTEHSRSNRHYLSMSHAQLKADLEYFQKTGRFALPSNKQLSDIDNLESKFADLSTAMKPSHTEARLPETVKDKPCRIPKEATHYQKQSALGDTDLLDASYVSHGQIEQSGVTTNAVDSKLSVKVPSKKDRNIQSLKEKSRPNIVRQRHPQCAAAGLDNLKHWAEVEKENEKVAQKNNLKTTNSNFQKANTDNALNDAERESELNDAHNESSYVRIKPYRNTYEPVYSCQSEGISYNEFYETEWGVVDEASGNDDSDDYTDDDDESSEYTSSEDDDHENYSSQSRDHYHNFIPPPPVLYHFGPTGHCFNPYLCTHPNPNATHEAFISHQVYHHALYHARSQVFGYY